MHVWFRFSWVNLIIPDKSGLSNLRWMVFWDIKMWNSFETRAKGPAPATPIGFSASFVYMKLQTGTHLLCGMMFWLAGFLEVFVPWINLFKYNRSNSFVIVFTCSIAFKRYQTWYGNNYLNLIDCQASQKKDEVLASLHRATSRDLSNL